MTNEWITESSGYDKKIVDRPDGLREESLSAETEARLHADTVAMARRTVAAMRTESAPVVIIDHSDIPADVLAIELRNAAQNPDGQVYPWRDLYPLVGQTVYAEGNLWIVAAKEMGAGADQPSALTKLVGCGHDESLIAARYELRPVTWTQHDEMWSGRE